MAKVLIVSDSHGLTSELVELKNRHEHEVDLMIHCGDSELEATDNAIENFVTVRGNCDYEIRYQDDVLEETAGKKFFVTHGHLYSVKSSLISLLYRAQEHQANIVCFGHSHILGAEMVQGILFINPGSLRLPRRRMERTYVILDIKEENVYLHVFDFDQGEIMELRDTFTLNK
ncbi:metallophosphoesterase [Cytobacillus sp. FJAT-54145]|uniref:Phosphoesterase n=1 Tax=Cytobacillus spartinae TaxID=3299023 RepID=A0ABW6KI27_9BACI